MKTLLTTLIIACSAVLPISSVQAAPAAEFVEFAAKKYGNFKAGDEFTLKVKNVTIVSSNGKIHPKMPTFRKGQNIKFKIGKKGELTGSGFSINYAYITGDVHDYLSGGDPYKLIGSAKVTKGTGKPKAASVTFNLVVISGPISGFGSYQVTYTF